MLCKVAKIITISLRQPGAGDEGAALEEQAGLAASNAQSQQGLAEPAGASGISGAWQRTVSYDESIVSS